MKIFFEVFNFLSRLHLRKRAGRFLYLDVGWQMNKMVTASTRARAPSRITCGTDWRCTIVGSFTTSVLQIMVLRAWCHFYLNTLGEHWLYWVNINSDVLLVSDWFKSTISWSRAHSFWQGKKLDWERDSSEWSKVTNGCERTAGSKAMRRTYTRTVFPYLFY